MRALYALENSSTQAPQTTEELERRHKQRVHLERELSKLRTHLAVSAVVSLVLSRSLSL